VQLVLLPDGDDPDSFIQKSGASRFHEYVRTHKQDVISFRMEVGMKEVGDDPVRKSKLVNEVAESISRINKAEDFALQDHYMRLATRKLQVEEAGFINLVNKYIREKVDQDNRQRRKDDATLPEPPPAATEDSNNIPLEQPKTDEHQEWELIRVLVEHGEKAYEGHANMAALEIPLARRIYDEYYQYIQQHGTPPLLQHFVTFPDAEMQQRMATLLQTNTDISPNWKNNYGIESLHGEHNYINEVESTLTYFELKKIKIAQAEIMSRLIIEKDTNKIMALIRMQMQFKQSEAEILKKMGTVIVKQLKQF
jgi:DNA primase